MAESPVNLSETTLQPGLLPVFRWRKVRLVIILVWVLSPTLACAVFSNGDSLNNQVRLAIYQYEYTERGPVDDLVIHASRFEPRLRFSGHSGRTVWLPDLAAREYFLLLPPDKSYLYIQEIGYNEDQTGAVVDVYRGNNSSYQGRSLTLDRLEDGSWQVVADTEITGD